MNEIRFLYSELFSTRLFSLLLHVLLVVFIGAGTITVAAANVFACERFESSFFDF
jgi:hypothetical protein